MNAAVQRRKMENLRLRQIVEKNRQVNRNRIISTRESSHDAARADAKLARLRELRQARLEAERESDHIRRRANPVRMVMITSILFFLGLGGLYFVSVARDVYQSGLLSSLSSQAVVARR
jgi:hypothetical protein